MDQNEFDALLRDRGWYYDNGWQHDSICWDCYQSNNSHPANEFFIVLANNGMGRLLKMTTDPVSKTEIWGGPLSNTVEIDALMAFIGSQKHG
jgi:hypothetical protein